MSGLDAHEPRLIELEERMAHLEAGMDALTDALLARERELRDAWMAIERLKGQLAELTPAAALSPEQEPPPPHY
ncbi:SlyX family protein [Acidihalobacter prosperus]|uniref:Protein SlyX homolog n=1 Tax=Acidihalobacter prosperus TaxID=160660 RepID=A0A1A6C5L7_9GAMM|nr:SlyX family protein [Acidihalobacter prosperus]OBS09857.1 hypothetical protein Thpro_020907 [Acidihalobacter prosperus]